LSGVVVILLSSGKAAQRVQSSGLFVPAAATVTELDGPQVRLPHFGEIALPMTDDPQDIEAFGGLQLQIQGEHRAEHPVKLANGHIM
jgi:hypothetical protein